MKPSAFFFKFGWSLWLLGIAGTVLVFAMLWANVADALLFPWRSFWLVLGAGGFVAITFGAICAVWEQD